MDLDHLDREFELLHAEELAKDKLCARCGHKRREHWTVTEVGGGDPRCDGTTLNIDFNCDACKCPEFIEPQPTMKCSRCGHEFYEHRGDVFGACDVFTFQTELVVYVPQDDPVSVVETVPLPVARMRRPSWYVRAWRCLVGKRP